MTWGNTSLVGTSSNTSFAAVLSVSMPGITLAKNQPWTQYQDEVGMKV
jgi:hypothetical protein